MRRWGPISAIPLSGGCDRLVPGSIGYRNTTGSVANQYRRIGTSVQGRGIWAEHWGSTSGPQIFLVGQAHGDECGPAFLVREVRRNPPSSYGVWVIPTLNPDGLVAMTRRNANGVDLNRDGVRRSQPETRALLEFTKEVRPALSVHLHAPYAWVGWHNGVLALRVAKQLSKAAGWGYPPRAGALRGTREAFLWQGQARVLAGHESVLVEFPAMSPKEAAGAPQPERTRHATVAQVERLAVRFKTALDAVFSSKRR